MTGESLVTVWDGRGMLYWHRAVPAFPRRDPPARRPPAHVLIAPLLRERAYSIDQLMLATGLPRTTLKSALWVLKVHVGLGVTKLEKRTLGAGRRPVSYHLLGGRG